MTLRSSNLLLLLVALFAIGIRAAVPAGFMPGKGLTLDICTGQGLLKLDIGAPGKAAKVDTECAFAGLTAPLLPATPFALLALAVAFVMARQNTGLAGNFAIFALRLRPPLRAPPAV